MTKTLIIGICVSIWKSQVGSSLYIAATRPFSCRYGRYLSKKGTQSGTKRGRQKK